ncbi:helix-turn-helix domain-containing protein [Acidianus sp. RZ1]|uniref:helix-turn-helix domain-containing protein n=1 Tax=Acidianus sp. RZ1 TaxID=1540082 RepID=UPI0014915275|nr:helix-turn-helix domain-containing protein [Acidianus sp. RZ1]NON62491.1 MarR family transcriptional regulator [Acidianus sp. RZ1]
MERESISRYTSVLSTNSGLKVRSDQLIKAIYGLSETDLMVLKALTELNSATANQISKRINVNKSSVIKSLKILNERGFVERSKSRSAGKGRPTFVYTINIQLPSKIREDLKQLAESF